MFKAKSTTKEARQLIEREIIDRYYDGESKDIVRQALRSMKLDADSYNADRNPSIQLSDYTKGAALVDAGCFRCYHSDQGEFLKKIYGNSVENWEGQKIHETYKHLIGREYAALIKKYHIE